MLAAGAKHSRSGFFVPRFHRLHVYFQEVLSRLILSRPSLSMEFTYSRWTMGARNSTFEMSRCRESLQVQGRATAQTGMLSPKSRRVRSIKSWFTRSKPDILFQ